MQGLVHRCTGALCPFVGNAQRLMVKPSNAHKGLHYNRAQNQNRKSQQAYALGSGRCCTLHHCLLRKVNGSQFGPVLALPAGTLFAVYQSLFNQNLPITQWQKRRHRRSVQNALQKISAYRIMGGQMA